jgi:hypothetical protein
MKHKKIFCFFTGLILGNIYFAIEDNNKLNKLRAENKEIQDRKINGQIIDGRRHTRIN